MPHHTSRNHSGSHQAHSGSHQAHSGSHQAHSGSHQAHFGSHQAHSGSHQHHSGSHRYVTHHHPSPSYGYFRGWGLGAPSWSVLPWWGISWRVLVYSLIIAAVIGLILMSLSLGSASVVVVPTLAFASSGAASLGTGVPLALSAAAIGLGVYAVVGLAYAYTSAKECYSHDKNALDVLKSYRLNEGGLSIKGIGKFIGTVFLSPFLLVGSLIGQGVKAVVMRCSSPQPDQDEEDKASGSLDASMRYPSTEGKDDRDTGALPVHTTLFAKPSRNIQEDSGEAPTKSM